MVQDVVTQFKAKKKKKVQKELKHQINVYKSDLLACDMASNLVVFCYVHLTFANWSPDRAGTLVHWHKKVVLSFFVFLHSV